MERQIYFIEEVAQILGVSRNTIDRRLKDGTFPIAPLPFLDRRTRFSKEAVEAYLKGKKK